jgi:hypothetical protein
MRMPWLCLAADAVAVDPQISPAVGPFEQLDVGAGDAVEADIKQAALSARLVDQVELVLDAEAVGEAACARFSTRTYSRPIRSGTLAR